ncbi:hypothetical protein BDK51DRAFT_19053 [Blyttiomyces helicus]|uniref:Uncharacterized protein n=1 Tax=Blyttiomyces helicus TaxID=388810 RepID=A0A4P9W6T7_9FUNG|nr:hypothetical protein BDK51DRAFT_19053 [Blyttiomyces helicus]|eukprot:RKO87095.1 hypothetical protein BDK51DRAFT_19053 [Blyttiomyces helicus]
MPPAVPVQTPPLTVRLSKLVLSIQFLWFVGHVTTALYYILYSRSSPTGGKNYSKAYYGTLLSYGIILYKSHGRPEFSRTYLQRILMDENTQYLFLSLIWVTSKPIFVTLIPFTTFSFFHTLNYTRTQLLPALFPPTSPSGHITTRLSPTLQSLVQNYQVPALSRVAFAEVWIIFPILIFSILTGNASIFTPVLYAQFLRFRYFVSPVTQAAFASLAVQCDRLAANERTPALAKKVYEKIREWVVNFGNAGQQQAAPAEPPAQ